MIVPYWLWPGIFLTMWVWLLVAFEYVARPKAARDHLVVSVAAALAALVALALLMLAEWVAVALCYRWRLISVR